MNREAGDLRADAHKDILEVIRVEGVAEPEPERAARAALVVPSAPGVDDLQGAEVYHVSGRG